MPIYGVDQGNLSQLLRKKDGYILLTSLNISSDRTEKMQNMTKVIP